MFNFKNTTTIVIREPVGSYTDGEKYKVDSKAEVLHQLSAQTGELFERFYDTAQSR